MSDPTPKKPAPKRNRLKVQMTLSRAELREGQRLARREGKALSRWVGELISAESARRQTVAA